ncbi:MAG: ATP-dependent helicase HrpB, partial [Actinobacteria bacterium]|nr:ATP-dependent helicase HrpB [Actinomycetota bacterium]
MGVLEIQRYGGPGHLYSLSKAPRQNNDMIRSGLPIDGILPDLEAALRDSGAAVLTAPPGSGKTTIVPLALLESEWLLGRILVLEPRRLATRAAARRMADLLGEDVGMTVGFTTRDERRVSPATRIEVVTEGVLTRRLQNDPSIEGTALIVFDEVHERNLQTDLGLALTLDVRGSLRPDLRILAMSATVQADRFAELLGTPGSPCPRLDASGQPYPVDIQYLPMTKSQRLEEAVANAVMRAKRTHDGDLLVFLPGAGEINRVAELLGGALRDEPVDVRPLYGMLPAAEQDAALYPSPSGRRRVVLATDIAESSLTVEGVRVVIDAGLARVPRYDVGTGMTRLRTVAASRSSADQRSGRAGRQWPGVAYRLWSKLEQGTRRAYLEPEITQVDLCGLALELAAWGTADPSGLQWLDTPPLRAYNEGRSLLTMLGALDADGRLTDLGRRINSLPLHPRLARMVIEAGTPTAAAIGALLEDRDVLRGRPDEVPTDLGLRLELLDNPSRRHPAADGRALGGARQRWRDIARRAGISLERGIDASEAGRDLALAYPDRLAVRRGTAGNFQLRSGTAATVPKGDHLAEERFCIVADLDGDRQRARVRIAAALSVEDVIER